VQLWVALPDHERQASPAFEHHADLPTSRARAFEITVFLGQLGSAASPATTFSPILGADLTAADQTQARIPLNPAFEHVVFVVTGEAEVEESTGLRPGQLAYLKPGREALELSARAGSRLILLGGVPLGERLLMWWNFVARTPEEIEAAAADWRAGRFGEVGGYQGEPLAAPPLNVRGLRQPRA
jgi:quercetin 2,3-dioxygenase